MDKYGRGAEREDFPASEALEAAIGEIRDTEEECPGVWYVSTYGGGEWSGTEFYVVEKDADTIPAEAKAYGTAIPGYPEYLLYPMDAERQVRKIIQYEELILWRKSFCRPRRRKSTSSAITWRLPR